MVVSLIAVTVQARPMTSWTTKIASRSRRETEVTPEQDTERRVINRQVIELNMDNYDSKVDEIAESLKQLIREEITERRQHSSDSTAGRNANPFIRHRQAVGPLSIMLETYVISQHQKRTGDLAASGEDRARTTELHLAMLQAGR